MSRVIFEGNDAKWKMTLPSGFRGPEVERPRGMWPRELPASWSETADFLYGYSRVSVRREPSVCTETAESVRRQPSLCTETAESVRRQPNICTETVQSMYGDSRVCVRRLPSLYGDSRMSERRQPSLYGDSRVCTETSYVWNNISIQMTMDDRWWRRLNCVIE